MTTSFRVNTLSATTVLVLALAASGCATTPADCDPAKGGYLTGMSCMASGGYKARQDEKQATLTRERQKQTALEGQYRTVQDQQTAVRAQRVAAERKYASLQSDLDAMRRKLTQGKTGNQQLEADVDRLKAQVQMLESDSSTPADQKAARLKELEKQKASLERQIEVALGN
jgi:chromosome segregation ATPase